MKKAIRLCMLSLAILCAFAGKAQALEPANVEAAAQELAALGLLRGTNQGFALEDPCDRLQGAALFTRLLGQEQAALAQLKPHPFLDISAQNWAAPYVAYLYNRGLAYGIAYNQYGLGPMQPQQFATFCLRALDYTEGSENSDFQWSESLDFMVEKGMISGNLRNRLSATAVFRRGDAVLLASATLAANLKDSGQTLLQHLVEQGVITAEQAAANSILPADLRIAYPQGMFAPEQLSALTAGQGLTVAAIPYAPGPLLEEDLYRQLRQPERSYDLCLVPGYVVEYLKADGLLTTLQLRDFGGLDAFIPALRDNPDWYDQERGAYIALPLAFEAPLLYYDSTRVQNPDWSWLFRAAYSGGIYMPADPTKLIPLAMHYYGLPYDTSADKKLLPVVRLLSEQAPMVTAYLDEHMLDIAEWPGAVLGVISSRDLPELNRRQQESTAYANWRAVLPSSGGPLTVYYAVIPKNGNSKSALTLLKELFLPENEAAMAQAGGYLPARRGAENDLGGAVAAAYPAGRGERCRLLPLDQQSRLFFAETMRNVFLDQAQNTPQPALASLEFSFSRDGNVYRSCRVDLANRQATAYWAGEGRAELLNTFTRKLGEAEVKTCAKELSRLGVALWQEFYDGPAGGPEWTARLVFADGNEKICHGYGLPPTWPDVAMALLTLTGADILPSTL